ncbi:MAG: L-serine ammonia-lyase, iron-sulfur-dependent, subunit alpha [Clostridium perfringens]|uniref:L-cysteine desulfidase family protein n=1 Tax=Clostridium perfringens TaxID=1502 RepID=UPI000D714CFF|nr:L-serine ammonia-lyase, iron-sulfur-dependent, subunit alpha [Clostridium perfringens]EHA1005894.1 serine dehydratase subunit alpha family protein [Clostridium perfringens]EHA1008875.1 serine dehydratase subunit alpha family protein [Clostridium perfringens]EHA1020864.1 serine dehydratase subunit alpha family protein [Clostridium perfringens]MBO3319435.1 serine dehydratase subunit alpha family protein [Clostridium perfringens]MDK0835875.1 L-serine ammonia-lyase, iron-sulfur-dependent, subun
MRELYLKTLKKEVVPSEGCTEPIAIAYAASIASEHLKGEIKEVNIYLSKNVIKNALGVGIPGTGGVGIEIAAALGISIQKSYKKLTILSNFTEDELKKAKEIVDKNIINIKQKNTNKALYIEVELLSETSKSKVIIEDTHTNVTLIECNDEIIMDNNSEVSEDLEEDYKLFKIADIYNFAKEADFDDIKFILESAKMNEKVSEEGLKGDYGLQVGSKIIQKGNFNLFSNDASNKIIAASAAASDARMDGCAMPIMTTAGSGNQGIACSIPVAQTARLLDKSEEELARALVLSNLVTIRIKKHMGRLSPLCGAGIAGATGASCGITYLLGGNLENINYCINNMISDLSGMICDGAKETCALKIATGTNAAIQCANLAINGISATANDGIVAKDVEETIESIETLIQNGFKNVDDTILNIMLEKKKNNK